VAIERPTDTSPEADASTRPPFPAIEQTVLTAAKGGGILFAGTLIGEALRLPIGIILARLLGPDQLGLYYLAVSAVGVVSGLSLVGMGSALVRYVSLFRSRRDAAGLWGALQVGIGLPAALSLCAALALFALADPIAERLLHEPRLVPLLRMISATIPFWTLMVVGAAATRGFKTMLYDAIANRVSQPLARLLLILLLGATIGLTATTALAAFGLALILSVTLLFLFLNRLFPLKRPLRAGRRDARSILRFALPLYAAGLLYTLGPHLNTLLLGALSTAANVGIFFTAYEVNRLGLLFHSSVAMASAPIVAELYDQGSRERLKAIYQTTAKWALTVSLPLFLAMLLFPTEILSVFGPGFVAGATALRILACASLASTATGISGVVISMTGNTHLHLLNSLVNYGLMLGLDYLLIQRWGLDGAAMATLVAVTATSLLGLAEVYVICRMLPYNLSFVKPLTAGLVGSLLAWGMGRLIPLEPSLLRAALATTGLLAIYAAMILLQGLSQEDRMVLARTTRRVSAELAKLGPASAARGHDKQDHT
jgi:O-antigen/teichoic acid export membrane protein